MDFIRRHTGRRGFYDDPSFARAEETMRTRAAAELGSIQQNLRRQGMDEATVQRLSMPYQIGTQTAFRGLVDQQRAWEEEQRQLRRARRRRGLGAVLGFAANLIPGIAQYRQASRELGLQEEALKRMYPQAQAPWVSPQWADRIV